MFTIEQIKATHAKVKSGVDFPAYIQEMKALGVTAYEHFVSDGHIEYYGVDDFKITADAKWPTMDFAEPESVEKLKQALSVHQQGQTDYPIFCSWAAEAGVEEWIINITGMTCTYYDKKNNEMLVEAIPEV